jgi:hypothetical protein
MKLPYGGKADRLFVLHANKVADEINKNHTKQKIGFAACHGFKSQKQYNHEEKNYE